MTPSSVHLHETIACDTTQLKTSKITKMQIISRVYTGFEPLTKEQVLKMAGDVHNGKSRSRIDNDVLEELVSEFFFFNTTFVCVYACICMHVFVCMFI